MTSTPRATASLMAPVTLPASEQEISTRRRAFVDRLRDSLRLDLPVLGRRRHPRDLDRHAMRGGQLLGGGLGAGARGEEHGIGRALGDHRDFQATGSGRAAGGLGRRRAAAAARARRSTRRTVSVDVMLSHRGLLINLPIAWRLPRAGVRQTACSPGRERPR